MEVFIVNNELSVPNRSDFFIKQNFPTYKASNLQPRYCPVFFGKPLFGECDWG